MKFLLLFTTTVTTIAFLVACANLYSEPSISGVVSVDVAGCSNNKTSDKVDYVTEISSANGEKETISAIDESSVSEDTSAMVEDSSSRLVTSSTPSSIPAWEDLVGTNSRPAHTISHVTSLMPEIAVSDFDYENSWNDFWGTSSNHPTHTSSIVTTSMPEFVVSNSDNSEGWFDFLP